MSQLTLQEILDDIKGFGIEQYEEPIVLEVGGKVVKLKLSNVPSDYELEALLAAEEYKGYHWIQRVKAEILCRSITSINDIDLRTLEGDDQWVKDPKSGEVVHYKTALRNTLIGWGNEVLQVIWKVLMVHCQNLEDRLVQSIPESATTTEVERKFFERALQELDELNEKIASDAPEEQSE